MSRRLRLVGLMVAVVTLSACTFGVPIGGQRAGSAASSGSDGPPSEAGTGYKRPTSYVVFGRRYFTMDSSQGFVEKGVASWYGRKFHGRATASGEIYNMHDMTAAHKSLPLPTWVRVRNLDNGKSIVVKVNDRGPFVDDRIIDLSWGAANKLDMVGPGTANVEIVALEAPSAKPLAPASAVRAVPLQSVSTESAEALSQPTPLPTPLPLSEQVQSDNEQIYIQLGSFSQEVNANNLRSELQAHNEKPIVITQVDTLQGSFYRVLLGPLLDVDEAVSVQKRLKRKGYDLTRILFVED